MPIVQVSSRELVAVAAFCVLLPTLQSFCRDGYRALKSRWYDWKEDRKAQGLKAAKPGYYGSLGSPARPWPVQAAKTNILHLCHGQGHSEFGDDFLNTPDAANYFVDADLGSIPDVHVDLRDLTALDEIPENSIDIIVFHYCSCHTRAVLLRSPFLMKLRSLLKRDGYVYVRNASLSELQSAAELVIAEDQPTARRKARKSASSRGYLRAYPALDDPEPIAASPVALSAPESDVIVPEQQPAPELPSLLTMFWPLTPEERKSARLHNRAFLITPRNLCDTEESAMFARWDHTMAPKQDASGNAGPQHYDDATAASLLV
jgi:hypothetical protein